VSAADRIAFARSASAEAAAGHAGDDGDDAGGDGEGGSRSRGPGGGTDPGDDAGPGSGQGPGGGTGPDGGTDPDDGDGDSGPDDAAGPEVPPSPRSPLAEVTIPLATLQGRAQRPGDNRLLGPLDPAMARDLAAAAARSPHSRWEVTIVDEHGYAAGHGIARPVRGIRPEVQPEARPPGLRQLAQAAEPRSGAPPGDWQLIPRKPGTWALILPGGRRLTVRFDVVPTHACDHRYQTDAYQPGDRLRRLVQVRDHECTFPTCSRPARDCDFEHAVPYDKGGITDACNAGARSRRCHQVKQMPGWTVSQPKPGWHAWTTPTGRTYTQEPWRYPA
jgi:hypothetical protein